ncbi:MAG: SPASM domain-containing protein [Bacteroidetes bacterium]|nr:SPASM domain-containing protein [Bacteroidota bacterium]
MGFRAKVTDAFQFLKVLNRQRIRNAIGLFRSYKQAKKKVPKEVKYFPAALNIEPTTSCNLRCPQCPSGLRAFTRPTGMMHLELAEKLIEELAPNLMFLTLYFQGEPYLNKDFNKMVSLAADKKIYTITSSNGHFFKNKELAEEVVNSGLNRLIISIDGVTQESYAHYRIGGQLEKALEGTREIMEAKKRLKSTTPYVVWQFIVFKHNQHELPAIKKLSKEYQVDGLQIKTAQVYDYETGDDWIPDDTSMSRYKKIDGKFVFKNSLLNHCWKMWHSAVVTWDGGVVPCCFDKDGKHNFGNVNEHSFTEIWQGPKYMGFRQKLFMGRKEIDICKNCSEGTKVFLSRN